MNRASISLLLTILATALLGCQERSPTPSGPQREDLYIDCHHPNYQREYTEIQSYCDRIPG